MIHFYLLCKRPLEVFHINNKKNELAINNEITEKEIRVIDSDGSMLGIMSTSEALELAYRKDLDLVKISPNAIPPVCKIADYNKTMYEKAKKEKEVKKSQKIVTLKEIRLSVVIEEHDLEVKIKNAHKFLAEGNKVKASVRFRGRQQKYAQDGTDVLSRFSEAMQEVGVIEKAPSLEGRTMAMILAPKKQP